MTRHSASIAIGIALATMATAAHSHDAIPTATAPLGWAYGIACCSGIDCRAVSAPVRVVEGHSGYTVPSGEMIPYGSTKIKQSKDEFFHWCTQQGKNDTPTICLYVPVRSF